ncbi:hypothetical protein SAMN02745938_1263 [Flavobacterium psychrophilum DSM 3660]|uniref:hypothetical protein n=1 Tax=Flavobacterium psychrophilum TaxID=96345 RepID=UPI000876A36C|nr:hypothetical protein [Flavobacterium psychrophilum]SCY39390.1 hypothetical protein SAMN02745938_1263 [Flavobacterium psychrophilum DSM 3660] [Flavobacterium psychrophilum DSM 3660 = ATCC 49418]
MMQRINIYRIVKDHLKTLRSLNQSYNFINIGDFLLFFIFPSIISLTLTLLNYNFIKQLDNLIASISILGGFLFNLLAIIYSQIENIKTDVEKLGNNDKNKIEREIKNKFINEIHSNISFAIVLSLFLILSLLSITIEIPEFKYKTLVENIFIFINYFLMQLFTLTLLMIINRIYILFKKTAE